MNILFLVSLYLKNCTSVYRQYLQVFLTETMHSLGISFLVFLILPNMDSLRAVVLLCGVVTVPLLLKVCQEFTTCGRNCATAFMEFGVLLLHSTGLLLWPILDTNLKHRILIPFALILISTGWWENYCKNWRISTIINNFIRI